MTNKQLRTLLLERQIERGDRLVKQFLKKYHYFFRLQLGAIIGGLLVSLATFRLSIVLSFLCIGIAVAVFTYSSYKMRSLKEGLLRWKIWVQLKKRSLARIHIDWENIPEVEPESTIDHPFEHDLDISGNRSLHQLVNTSFSDGGRKRLLQWMLAPTPDRETISTRQQTVHELLSRTSFREKLQIASLNITQCRRTQRSRNDFTVACSTMENKTTCIFPYSFYTFFPRF